MRVLLLILVMTFSLQVISEELTIKYDYQPTIFIYDLDFDSFGIEPDGKGTWISDVPVNRDKNGQYDEGEVQKQIAKQTHVIQYSEKEYREVLVLVLALIKSRAPSNLEPRGEGYTAIAVSLWGNPNITFRYGSIDGNDFPDEVFALRKYLTKLGAPNNFGQQGRAYSAPLP
jgi:hypothetical protein